MSRITSAGPPPKRPPHNELDSALRVVIVSLLLVAAPAAAYAVKGNAAPSQPAAKAFRVGQLDRSHAGDRPPNVPFETRGGKVLRVADFKGRAVLVNLWATWCVPCRAEMPELDALAKARAGKLTIVPVSADLEGWRAVAKYFTPAKFPNLQPYLDQPGNFPQAMGATGLPVSILYGPDGRERWRVNGPLKWGSAQVAAALG